MNQLLAQTQITNPGLSQSMQNLSGEQFLGNFISAAISLILIVGTIAAFFMFLIGGLQLLTSGGDKAGTEAARGRITHAIIGLVLLFAAWAIILLLQTFLGIQIIGGKFSIPIISP